jgi:multiple sugar transport system permease protein
MVLPAVLIIAVIAVWPLIRTFWISMYDLRLNDPARNELNVSYGINAEKYANSMPLLLSLLNKEAEAASGKSHTELRELADRLARADAGLREDAALQTRLDRINALLDDFKPVPADMQNIHIDKTGAERMRSELSGIGQSLQTLKEQGTLSRADEAIGLAKAVQQSFTVPNFVGFGHYARLLSEPRLWEALDHTALFTAIAVTLEMLAGLLIALLMNRAFRGRGLVRAAVLIPWATPTAISAMIWHFLYDGQNGIVAKLFAEIGLIPDMGALLSTRAWALFAVVLADVWKTAPFVALLLLAGLQTISASLYEAAQMDGASRWKQFVHVTVPMLKPTFFVALLFRTLDAFRVFDLIYVLTGGGPANSTESISIYAYKTMFAELDFGAGSALSVIVFACVLLISIVYVKLLGGEALSRRIG